MRIEPDVDLLNLMMEDHSAIEREWQVGPYWETIAKPLAAELGKPEQIQAFRRLAMRTGIRSEMPNNPSRQPFSRGIPGQIFRTLRRIPVLGAIAHVQDDLIRKHVETFQHKLVLAYLFLRERDKDGLVLDDQGAGEPDSVVEIDGRVYEDRSLGYQNLYQWLAGHIAFDQVRTVLDLGSGYGGQIEVLLRRHPHLRCVAMDIPPWLYVAQVYLEALFPGQVLGYRATRDLPKGTRLLDHMKDKRVAIVAAWKWKDLDDQYDLFWNSKSIQEMNDRGPAYLALAAKHCDTLFLHAWRSSKGKVLSPSDLKKMVVDSHAFKLQISEEDLFAWRGSENMLFTRTAAP